MGVNKNNMGRSIAFLSIHGDPQVPLGGPHHGGQNVYVKELSRHLSARNFRVDVYSRWESPRQLEVERIADNSRVIRVRVGPPNYIPKDELVLLFSDLAQWITQYRDRHQIDYSLIHAHYYFSGAVALKLYKRWGAPFVETFHSLGAIKRQALGDQDPSPSQRVEIEQSIVRNADQIIATAPQEKNDLIEVYNADPTQISVVPCGVNLELFRPISQDQARKDIGIPSNAFLLTYVGRIEQRKGIDTMLKALALLLTEHPNLPLYAIIVGGQPRNTQEQFEMSTQERLEHQRYEEIIEQNHIRDRVIFTGGLPQSLLYQYYSAADITIIPSYYEPFGMTALEALACGSSVIASRVGGLKTTIKEGEVGLHFTPQVVRDLADNIFYLMQNPKLNARFKRNARPYVKRHFSWQSVAEKCTQVYTDVLSKHTD
ncbi:MAG: glycosyltransferase [Anaerolineales bacterium]